MDFLLFLLGVATVVVLWYCFFRKENDEPVEVPVDDTVTPTEVSEPDATNASEDDVVQKD